MSMLSILCLSNYAICYTQFLLIMLNTKCVITLQMNVCLTVLLGFAFMDVVILVIVYNNIKRIIFLINISASKPENILRQIKTFFLSTKEFWYFLVFAKVSNLQVNITLVNFFYICKKWRRIMCKWVNTCLSIIVMKAKKYYLKGCYWL